MPGWSIRGFPNFAGAARGSGCSHVLPMKPLDLPSVFRPLLASLPLVLLAGCATTPPSAQETAPRWTATWSSAQQLTEPHNLPPPPGLDDTTLRQTLRISVGGSRLRIRLSNAFGNDTLHIVSAHVARAVAHGDSRIEPGSDRTLTFHGREEVSVPVGALMVSDPVEMAVEPLTDLAVTLYLRGAPSDVTGHPGSRTTSFLQSGNAVAAEELPEAVRTDHWYFVTGVEVWTETSQGAVAIIGDSITDGRGSTTNGNDRWPDQLLQRLQADPRTAGVAVLNQGIGGNRLLRDGLGPSALARLDRDVLAQPGVRWLVVFEGVNDLGTAAGARERGEWAAGAEDVIAAYEQIIARARACGLRVYGATITPFGGSFYDTPQAEADRQAVNTWIRTSGQFDAVIDFDAVVRDPEQPTRLAAAFDTGDHLHLSPAGYRAMAEAIDLSLFYSTP